jgi:hypothetical protein
VVRAVPRWRKVAAVLSAVGVVYLFSRGPEMIPLAVMLIAVPIMLPLNFATELRWRTDERIRRWARARDWPDVTIPSAYARRWPGPPFDGVSQAVVREVVSGPVESITVTSMTLVPSGARAGQRGCGGGVAGRGAPGGTPPTSSWPRRRARCRRCR